jgi:DNA-binding NtrC family response regulator
MKIDFDVIPTLEMVEEAVIRLALELAKGNQAAVARALGVSRPTIRRKMVRYKIARVCTCPRDSS